MYLSKENKNTDFKRYMHPYIHCSFVYNSQDIETTYISIDELVKKMLETYLLLCHKKIEI